MPFEKGKSGNPGGRPKTKHWRDAIRRAVLDTEEPDPNSAVRNIDRLALALVEKALSGDVPAMKEIGDRLDGKPSQAITGEDGGPIETLELSNLSEPERKQRYAAIIRDVIDGSEGED